MANEPICPSLDRLQACYQVLPPPSDRVFDPGSSDHCIMLHLTNQDYLERRIDGGKIFKSATSPGTLTFLPANREAEWLWEAEVEVLELYFPPVLLEEVGKDEDRRREIELSDRFAIRDPFLKQIALTCYTELQQKSPHKIYLESLQNILSAHLLRHHCTIKLIEANLTGGLSKSKVTQIIDYIHHNLDRDLGLIELADLVQISSHHFGKLFKQSLGLSPHQYILQCRLTKAKKLLATPLTLAEISQSLGFCDQSHFTNTFRRHTNLTPRQYRNQL